MSESANRSVGRALTILETLAVSSEPLSLTDIATALSLPKSSALVLLRALQEHEFVHRDEMGRYAMGMRAFETGSAYIRGMSSVKATSDQLRWLTETLGVTAHFAVLDGNEVVYVAKEDPRELGVRLASFVGARLPAATTAVGTAQFAHMKVPTDLLREHPTLERRLEETRERGYAVDDGAIISGVKCVAAAVMDGKGCCGAIGVSYLQNGDIDEAQVAEHVMRASATATVRLGGRSVGVA